MDPAIKARLIAEGGKIAFNLLRLAIIAPTKVTAEVIEEQPVAPAPAIMEKPARLTIELPTAEETTIELKRRLARELYRAELDLDAGLKIANKPCDCLSNKHTLMLEAAAEELISQDPNNATVYQDIIAWIPRNASKVSPEAIQGGKYASEYPRMANELKNFRKRVMGSVGKEVTPVAGKITLEQAKKMAAEEAAKEVERVWNKEN